MYINPVVSGKRTLGSISCNTTTSRPLRLIPSQLSALGVSPGLRTSHETIAPHWSSSYPEYLSPNQDQEEQSRVVWSRLHDHRANLANRLATTRDKYYAARRALNPRTTQAESSHDPLYRDIWAVLEFQCICHAFSTLASNMGTPHREPEVNVVVWIRMV